MNITIVILYFSGAGATKYVEELMREYLGRYGDAALIAMEHADGMNLEPYDALIIGTPVHHAALAARVIDYTVSGAANARRTVRIEQY